MSALTEQNAAWFAKEEHMFVRNTVISLPVTVFSSSHYFREKKNSVTMLFSCI